jgi:hypothetical protein
MPWRVLAMFFVPAGALAAGVGLQRLVEGAQPDGDALFRWLLFSCGAGLVLGLVVGLLRGRWWSWALYGAAVPWLAVGLSAAIVAAVRPFREAWADRREKSCHAEGRTICSVNAFREACQRNDRASLGQPINHRCDASGCTSRWTYAGPFRPENYIAPGVILCSVVTSPDGKPLRASVIPGPDPR